MKSQLRILLFLVLCCAFYGCPYESELPIDPPYVKLREELLGSWENPKKGNRVLYVVGRHDPFRYRVEQVLEDTKQSTTKYLGHLSIIKGITFLNLQEVQSFKDTVPDSLPVKYYLFKIVYKGGLLTLSEVSQNITEHFKSSQELRSFIGANMQNSYFFNREEMLLINKYEIEKNEKEVLLLNKDKVERELQLQRSKTFNIIVLVALIFVFHFALLLWYFYYNRNKTIRLILEKKKIMAKLEGEASERNRIAGDLHDRVGSMLATVKLYFSSIEDSSFPLNSESQEQFDKASELLDEACGEIRKISHELSSVKISTPGIVNTLEKLKENITKSNKLIMEVNTKGMVESLEADLESELCRIVLELTNNVIRHSGASCMEVSLDKFVDHVHLRVADNGNGLLSVNKQSDGIGLNSIRMRVMEREGTMNVSSEPGKGSSIDIYLPVA